MSYKLFIPGPIAVSEKTLRAMAQPMIGHRSNDFVALYQSIQPDLQALFFTQDPVYISTSSAWGVMEGAIRNLTQKKVLCCMNGAFSDKWLDVAQRSGLAAAGLKSEWGQPVDPEALRKELATGQYDTVTLIHNETSCGCMSDLPAIAAVLKQFPDVISIVDTVSSFSAMPIKKDELGIDVIITGSQKALALPPGLSLLTPSKRALARAALCKTRGYYFDLLEFQKNHEAGMTPSTPVIPLIYALKSKLEDIKAEGAEARYARHARLNKTVRDHVLAKGFKLFPKEGHGSVSLNCFANTLNVDLAALNKILKSKHKLVIDGGYGKLKGLTFRISNMGDETDETIAAMLKSLDAALAELGAK
ncbi:alanine--glyoxylate aminotransferase family protein [Oleiharenicola lentus]|uniref:Alanine--glyoxylate aminotransferase family protein n=1 Tax=Oleiharenicola lentus TaxID=2508720 RepID=A0A4Q1CAR2_9BACT|nr:alanine--glyoxylate aminotransferase family protein [Oleiharenicola lentus]RXK55971.1 alanine--glyoxylate aminotransferase family protein [Oleiharenicola lentus]